jgi:hypothetical protein
MNHTPYNHATGITFCPFCDEKVDTYMEPHQRLVLNDVDRKGKYLLEQECTYCFEWSWHHCPDWAAGIYKKKDESEDTPKKYDYLNQEARKLGRTPSEGLGPTSAFLRTMMSRIN